MVIINEVGNSWKKKDFFVDELESQNNIISISKK